MPEENRSHILLVEDNDDDLELTLHALQRGHLADNVDVARDGVEALDYLHRRGKYAGLAGQPLPRVVMLDIKLPFLDGIEVLRELRGDERTRNLPVVMMTSSAEDRDLKACYDLGANSYVVKPVDLDQFFHAVQQIGMYWMVVNEPRASIRAPG